MPIIINIDVMLAKRKMSVTELSQRVGITMANISILKNGKAKALRIETLDKTLFCMLTNFFSRVVLKYISCFCLFTYELKYNVLFIIVSKILISQT